MLDIFEDSCDGLEIDRIKDKIRSIWNAVITAEYNEQYANQKEDAEDYVSMEDYIKEHQLYFPGDDKPENEIDNLLSMLDDMLDPKEDLDPVSKEGKAPTYNGKQLSENNEKGKVDKTEYKVKHSATITPKDSKSVVKSMTYVRPTGGKEPKSNVHERSTPISIEPITDLLDIERSRLLRLVARRNKEYGVRL